MKKVAHCIHHTHWDLIWYFTVQDATAQFAYNMKEMIRGFRNGSIQDFFMDGQSAPVEEYLRIHPEDEDYIKELIRNKRFVIGPFQSQLDCFISSGESVINNLRLGMKSAKRLGHISRIAYLPDSFGHSYDFPKIFNKFDIHDFVITRGVGDNYELDSEFYMESNDGSNVLVCTMIAGYGYGCYAFKDGTLFKESALDYNKISVSSLIDRLLKYSTIKNEFVFPLGFDQNPAMLHIKEKMDSYNASQNDIHFKMTTWENFTKEVRERGEHLKTHTSELFSPQYHRLHKSIFSARADIKALQDQCERVLTYELQPIMSMLDSIGIPYDHGLIDKAWDTLLLCQTHSSANLTDETNQYIERETRNALQLAISTKVYLMKLVSISVRERSTLQYPLVIFHTLAKQEKNICRVKVLTHMPYFKIMDKETPLTFTVEKMEKKNCGVLRKDLQNMNKDACYYETDILLETGVFDGISYKVYDVICDEHATMLTTYTTKKHIENEYYELYQDEDGIVIYDKKRNKRIKQAIYLEESGDEGDSFDYSYPTHDMKIVNFMDDANVQYTCSQQLSTMKITGEMIVPSNLKKRKHHTTDDKMGYTIVLTLKKEVDTIEIEGGIDNHSEQHRVRFVVRGNEENQYSYAGTQYGMIKRDCDPIECKTWKEDGWFEEPSPTNPLLNHVSMVHDSNCISVFTRSSKEYEFINEGKKDLAITLFRSYGAMGYPDLNRRPGRPSGLDYMIFETPSCQMKKHNTFALGLRYSSKFCENEISNAYTSYACDISYYQRQDFDKSLYPIAYFPTNSWPTTLPDEYSFLCIKSFEGSYATVVKSDISNSYIIRLYNNTLHTIVGGKIHVHKPYQFAITNMEETDVTEIKGQMPAFKAGELRFIRMMKEEEKL